MSIAIVSLLKHVRRYFVKTRMFSSLRICQKKTLFIIGIALFSLPVFVKLYIHKPDPFNSIIVHHNICIVTKQNGQTIEIENGVFMSEKEIVVYNAKEAKTELMKVTASSSANVDSWPVRFENKTIPRNFMMQTYPAYFIIATYPENLYHWWHDSTLGLYGAMKLTKGLNSTVANQVLHRNPIVNASFRTRFADIVKAFSVRDDQNVYHAMPSGTCYPFGVFGYKQESQEEVADFVTQKLDKKYAASCPSGVTVTLIQRSFRKILNIEALLNVLLEAGFNNSQVVNLERMTFREQWETIRCTNILVGVQGAGLQWAVFLRPKSALLELAHKGWDFMFSDLYKNFNGLKTGQLRSIETHPDWDYISKLYFGGKPMTEAEKAEVLASRNNIKRKDLWGKAGFKWADSKYNSVAFKKEILRLLNQ